MRKILSTLVLLFFASIVSAENLPIWLDKEVTVSFETNGYKFYSGYYGEMGDPAEAFLKLIAVKDDQKIILQSTTSLKGYVSIKNEEEALEFVRLFTNPETHYLFEDSDWIEIMHSNTDILGGELLPGMLLKSDFEKLGMFEPQVTRIKKKTDVFIIKRCVLNSKNKILTTREVVWANGDYSSEIISKSENTSNGLWFPFYE